MQVHRLRGVDYVPVGVRRVAFSGDGYRLAVARDDADIEVWQVRSAWAPEFRVPGRTDGSVQCLAWASTDKHKYERLFAAGLDGKVCEVDFATCGLKNVCDSFGGAVWDIALNSTETLLAVGCEDGGVRLFDVTSGSIEFVRQLATTESRVLSLCWHPLVPALYSGSASGSIRGWDVSDVSASGSAGAGGGGAASSRAVVRMRVEDYGKGEATLVWCLRVLRDFTVLSGDSLGNVQVWDGRTGTQIHSLKLHHGDVMSLGLEGHGDTDTPLIFSAGVDGKVAALRRTRDPSRADGWRWLQCGSHRTHTHDVRSVAVSCHGSVVSGGGDAQLCVVQTRNIGSRQPRKVCSRCVRLCAVVCLCRRGWRGWCWSRVAALVALGCGRGALQGVVLRGRLASASCARDPAGTPIQGFGLGFHSVAG